MIAENPSRTKTQTLSLRLDPKTRFILEFMSRIKGQTITVVVERAIKEAADAALLGPQFDNNSNEFPRSAWTDFWDPDEGVRTLKLLADRHFPSTYDEDEIRRFTLDHREFFYADRDGKSPIRAYATVLWPNIEKYMEIWRRTKTTDYWAAGTAMAASLNDAQISPPTWPRGAKKSEEHNALAALLSRSDKPPL